MKKTLPVILFGMLLIAVLVPCAQFLTMGALNHDLETASPVGWAIGLVFSFVLVAAVVRVLAKRRTMSRPNIVILYCMLTIGVPLMNIGLIRPLMLSIYAVAGEYLNNGTSTYRTAYNAQDPDWFPVVPPTAELAWNKADRLLRFLQENAVLKERANTQRLLVGALAKPPVDDALIAAVAKLGVDEVLAVQAADKTQVLGAALQSRLAAAESESAAAATRLVTALENVDEQEASMLQVNWNALDQSSRVRLERELQRLSVPERAALQQRIEALELRAGALRTDASQLSRSDFARVRTELAGKLQARYAKLSDEEIGAIRGGLLYRMSRAERNDLIKQDGTEGKPNLNLAAFRDNLWSDQVAGQRRARQTMWQNLDELSDRLPWQLWVKPLLLWGTLCAVIFGLLLLLADWLRHKWIERENLAFPLVEAADFLIRHDSQLETAEDLREPAKRKSLFSPVWWVGVIIGAVWISAEALGHYGFTGNTFVVYFDVSKEIFGQNAALREMTHVYFVLSPIVLGLAFLVSLEVSFSVWVLFFGLNFVFMLARLANPNIVDPLYTGYGGGRLFPFWMEQFIGACLCYSALVIFKSLGGRERSKRWIIGGVLGTLLVGLLWSMGQTNLAFLALVVLFVTAQTIAAARVRAETGLHTHHVSYEFTKFPMVFGVTGWTGAEIYTRFISLAVLPVTLLMRVVPQQLENYELARRHKVPARTITISAIAAFVTAITVGMVSFLVLSYFWGTEFSSGALAGQGGFTAHSIASYPLWVSHFFGENGLNKFTSVHWIRIGYMLGGAALVGLLVFLRQRFLRFPLHPLGYMIILVSIYYDHVSPYFKGDAAGGREASWLWGSVFVAWITKKLVIKYGGMNTFKQAKPLFLGLVVGAIVTVFAWNMTDFIASARHRYLQAHQRVPGEFIKHFEAKPAFSPRFY